MERAHTHNVTVGAACALQVEAIRQETAAMHTVMKAGEAAALAERRRSKQLDMALAAKPSQSLLKAKGGQEEEE